MIFVVRAGSLSEEINVEDRSRAVYLETKDARDKEIARRKAGDIELDGLMPMGDYEDNPALAGVNVVFRYQSKSDVDLAAAKYHSALHRGVGDDVDEDLYEIAKRSAEVVNVASGFLRKAVESVSGLSEEIKAGPDGLSKEDAQLLGDANLILTLYSVAMHAHRLDGDQKKRLWSPAQPT
ncbi:MAG: hypothetical protein ACPG6R_11015 [Aequoribacter sp.]|uniref:hypothetical protein n=1 Tax=Aequoribacter sp. TaxID=2847771 RepID=UPI003C516E1E